MNVVSRIGGPGNVYVRATGKIKKKMIRMARPEQKSIEWMLEPVVKYSDLVNLYRICSSVRLRLQTHALNFNRALISRVAKLMPLALEHVWRRLLRLHATDPGQDVERFGF